MRRLLWRLAYPFALALNGLGMISYRWVNISRSAWRRDFFDALWHYRHFGDPVELIPSSVSLCGMQYRVAKSNDAFIAFHSDDGSGSWVEFIRGDPRLSLFLVRASSNIPMIHVKRAYQWVEAVYVDSDDDCTKG